MDLISGRDTFAMASEPEEKTKMESLTSPAAFVEGGIQDVCDDACSICLEDFCESDPSAV
jgi:E3 ubiquitin-protein ligase RHF